MSWRNQGITGSNNIPLGKRRAFGGDDADEGGYNPAEPATGMSELKRGRSPTRGKTRPRDVRRRILTVYLRRCRRTQATQEAQPMG